MIKIYDSEKNFLKLIDICKDMRIVSKLDTGYKKMSFRLPINDENLSIVKEEGYVSTADYNYVIKEVNENDHDFMTVYCNPDIEALKYSFIPVYDIIDKTIQQALESAVTAAEGWSVDYQCTYINAVEYHLLRTTPYEVIRMIQKDFDLDVFFDTKEKKVRVWGHKGENRGVYFSNELRLKLLKKQSQCYSLITVLYPVGKNGINISSVNNGSPILENFDYCNKYLAKYWEQPDIEQPQQLKMLAEAYLNYYSAPITSYAIELSGLPQDIELGDDIIIVDKIKRVKQKQRVKVIYEYPFEPEKNRVEISNAIVNFADTLTKFSTDMEKQIEYIKKNLATLE